jgi:tetratricopeptide (TPR) repeat protein
MAHLRVVSILWLVGWLIGGSSGAEAQPPIRTQPMIHIESDVVDAYVRLLERYRVSADADTKDPSAPLFADLRAFWSSIYGTYDAHLEHSMAIVRITPDDLVPLAAMAVTDLGIALLNHHDVEIGDHYVIIAGLFVDRLMASVEAVRAAKKPPTERDLDRERFAREWHHLMIWLRMARSEQDQARRALNRARSRFPDDAELPLSEGSLEELEAQRLRLERSGNGRSPSPLSKATIELNKHILTAISSYRQAIARDPNAAEARIRLAFLLTTQGGHAREEARTLLKEAQALTTKPQLTYLAALFAGNVDEQRGDEAAASLSYRTAIATCPRAQTARLALSHLQLHASDDERAAHSTLRPLIGGPPAVDWVCEPDPWRMYDLGQAWRLPELVPMLRKQVKEAAKSATASGSGSQP